MYKLSISYPQFSSSILQDLDFTSKQLKIQQIARSISILTVRRARLKLKRLQYVTCWLTMKINHPLDEAEDLIQIIRKYRSSLRALEEKFLTHQHVEQGEFNYLTKRNLRLCELRLIALHKRFSHLISQNRLSLDMFDQISQDISELDQIILKLRQRYGRYLSGKFPSEILTEIYTVKYKVKLREVDYGENIMTLDNRYIFYCDLSNPPFILYDITTQSVFRTFDREVQNIKKIVPAPNNQYISLAADDQFLLWYFKDDKIIEIDNPYRNGYILEITSDSKCIISISTKYICIWSLKSKRLINCIEIESSYLIYKSALSSNDEYLAISDSDNNIEIWSLVLNRRINFIRGDQQGPEVYDLKFACKDTYLIIAFDCFIYLYNIKKKRSGDILGLEYSSVDFRGVIEDRYIFYRGYGNKSSCKIWDLKRERDIDINFKHLSEAENIIGDSTVFSTSTHLYGVHMV